MNNSGKRWIYNNYQAQKTDTTINEQEQKIICNDYQTMCQGGDSRGCKDAK